MRYVRRRFKPHSGLIIAKLPHTIQIFNEDRLPLLGLFNVISPEVNKWCNENIGEYQKFWHWGMTNSKLTFYFYSKDAAVAFKLRWS